MIRFLVACCILLILYLGFSLIAELDTTITFSVYDYIIETSLFTLVAGFTLSLFTMLLILKLTFLIFEFPHLIKKRLILRKSQKINQTLMQAMAYLLANNKFKANEISKKIETDLKTEHKDLYNLIRAESEESFEKKVDIYRLLTVSKDYNYFAIKKLAAMFLQNNFYEQAEDYATKAFNINEFDSDILEILIHCYSNQKKWNKFIFMVSKLNRVDSLRLSQISSKVANYYFQAAKDTLELGEDHQAMSYAGSALELNPSNPEALDFYLSLNLSLNHGSDNLEILRNAFSINPTFELAEMYIKSSNNNPQQVYNELAAMADPDRNRKLFLAIAAILNLQEKVEALSPPKLLSHYN